ncbi:MAG: TRAP transporter substrate-binding protein [Mastigocoleus sp.]
MKRRDILAKSAIASATVATVAGCRRFRGNSSGNSAPGVKTGLPIIRWDMPTSWPKSLVIFSGAETIAKRVSEMTDGRFIIKAYAGGELVPPLGVLDAVQEGNAQCGHTASYFYIGKSPALAFATCVPFGFNAQQQNSWLYHGEGLTTIQKIYADNFNIINFPAGNTGTQMGGWFKKEIKSLSDLQGLKMRIPGLGGQVMKRLGVNVQVLPGSEIYVSLGRGAIDAAEWIGPYDDEKIGLHNAAKFYCYPGWWEPGSTLDVLVNLRAWEKLPPEYQAAFKTAAYEANLNMLCKYEALNGKTLNKLVKGGTKLVPYSQDILQAAQKAAFEILDDSAQKNVDFRKVYEQWKNFRENIYQWNSTNELSFSKFVTGND